MRSSANLDFDTDSVISLDFELPTIDTEYPTIPMEGATLFTWISAGDSSMIWLARDPLCSSWVALKIVAGDQSSKTEKNFIQCHNFLSSHNGDPRFITYKSYFHIDGPNGRHLCLVLPFCGTNLRSLSDYMNSRMKPRFSWELAYQATELVADLHARGICHGNARPGNLLLRLRDLDHLDDQGIYRLFGQPQIQRLLTTSGEAPGQEAPRYVSNFMDFLTSDEDIFLNEISLIGFDQAFEISSPRTIEPLEAYDEKLSLQQWISDIWDDPTTGRNEKDAAPAKPYIARQEDGSHPKKYEWINDEVCFPHHPFDVQLYVGIYSWLGLLLDDQAGDYLDEFSMFHERFCADTKQPIPLLQIWADLMKLTFKHWDPLVANFIVTASLNFLNSNALEARKEFHQIGRTKEGRSWAWFLRDKDGVGEAYGWFTFPKVLCPDISLFLEVVPDISMWVGLTNDVLSFYKEEKAGETHNYIHNRGWYEDEDAQSVFEDIVEEVTTKVRGMRLVLKDRDPYLTLLNSQLLGYIAFHKLNSRYRLWEVGLGELATDRTVLNS
ncbi:longiborneol synthase [Fusarium beomiforme]|uniref:Longiborneol synthase n=1 Tax=Fusarium beomiforme TaxID=44412 RepID=A0A9P5AK39_9HYPO|nr:longiborneol synthase [Fusarium beomiforme]